MRRSTENGSLSNYNSEPIESANVCSALCAPQSSLVSAFDQRMMRDPYSELTSEMDSGEKLLWAGKPKGGFLLRPSDVFMIPFSIFWCGFAIFWMVGATDALWADKRDPTPFHYIFPLFGLPFVLMGLCMVFGRFFVDKAQREKTTYGVSSERVPIKSGLFSSTVKSLNLRTLSDITLKERTDGSGTVTFGASFPMFTMFEGMTWWPGANQYQSPSFDSIPNAKKIYNMIRQQQK